MYYWIAGIARTQGKRVLFRKLKNSVEDLAIRLLSIGSRVPVRNILLNQMTEEDWEKVTQSFSTSKDNEILFYNSDNDYLQLNKILDEIKTASADLIIIDDLQMVEDERNHYIKDRMDCVLKSIKAIGIQMATPVIGAYCIPSKTLESRPDYRPQLVDMEYNILLTYPDNIQLLYCDEMHNPDSEHKNIEEIKSEIRRQRVSVVLNANSSMICLYWNIGKAILEKQEKEGWGAKVIDRMAKNLKDAFPDMSGFSPRNIKYMRKFAEL